MAGTQRNSTEKMEVDDETVNLMQFTSTIRPQVRVGLALEGRIIAQEQQGRHILDETIVEVEPHREYANDQQSEETIIADEQPPKDNDVSPPTPATAPKVPSRDGSAVNEQMVMERPWSIDELFRLWKTATAEKMALEVQLQGVTSDHDRERRCWMNELEEFREFHNSEFSVLDAERQELQERLERSQVVLEEHTATIYSLRALVDQRTATADSFKAERDAATRDIEELFTEIHSSRRRIQELERSKDSLQQKCNDLQKTVEEFQRHQVEALSNAEKRNDAAFGQLVSELKAMKEASHAMEVSLARKTEELEAFRSAALEQTADAEKELASRDQEIDHLENELRSATERIRLFQQSSENVAVADLNRRSQETARIQQLEAERQSLKDQLTTECDRSKLLEARLVRLEKLCDDSDSVETALRSEVEELKNQLHRQKKLEQVRFVDSVAAAGQSNNSEKNLERKIAQLEELLATERKARLTKEEELVRLNEKFVRLSEKYRRHKETPLDKAAPVASAAQVHVDAGHVTGGSSIAEMGRQQMLEQNLYQMRKRIDRLEKENANLRQQAQQLRSPDQNYAGSKENNDGSNGTPRHLRRANSECEKSGVRPLQESTLPNSPAGNLFTTAYRQRSRSPLFPPVFSKK